MNSSSLSGAQLISGLVMGIAGLPSDIPVAVTANNIATRSSTPLSDIVNLRRRSCKVLRDATVAREVQLCMAVRRERRLHRWDKTRFMSVLRRRAMSGNPEALVNRAGTRLSLQIMNVFICHHNIVGYINQHWPKMSSDRLLNRFCTRHCIGQSV